MPLYENRGSLLLPAPLDGITAASDLLEALQGLAAVQRAASDRVQDFFS